jgi:hypothetical protein
LLCGLCRFLKINVIVKVFIGRAADPTCDLDGRSGPIGFLPIGSVKNFV